MVSAECSIYMVGIIHSNPRVEGFILKLMGTCGFDDK